MHDLGLALIVASLLEFLVHDLLLLLLLQLVAIVLNLLSFLILLLLTTVVLLLLLILCVLTPTLQILLLLIYILCRRCINLLSSGVNFVVFIVVIQDNYIFLLVGFVVGNTHCVELGIQFLILSNHCRSFLFLHFDIVHLLLLSISKLVFGGVGAN
jgi:hypothetical protein